MTDAGAKRNGKLLDVYLLADRENVIYRAQNWEDAYDFCDSFGYRLFKEN